MKPTGEQLEQIEDALLDGYDEAGLERLVRHRLDEHLDRIAGGDNLTEIVHNLVAWAEREGRLGELIATAHDQNPRNKLLQAVYAASTTWQAQIVDSKLPTPFGWRRWLWPLLGLAVLIAVAAAGGFAWRMSRSLCGGNPLCVLVAEFSSQDRQEARALAEEIRSELVEELGDDVDKAVIRLARRVDDEGAAKALATDEGALLLIWGSIKELGGNRVRVRFELADRLGVGQSAGLRTFRAEPINYDAVSGQVECTDCFDVSLGKLGQRIDVVAHAAAGFLHYADHPELAYHEFLKAMHCAGEAIDPTLLDLLDPQCEVTEQPLDWNPQLLTYYAGKSAALSGDYAAAVDLLTRAAEQNPADPAAMLGIAAAYQGWIGEDDAPEVLDALDEAERRIEELVENVSEKADLAVLRHDLGLAHELAGDWEAAADEYGKAASLFGENSSAYVSLVQQGHAQRLAGAAEGAEATLLHAAEFVPSAPWAYLELAELAWHGHEDKEGALMWLQKANDVTPNAVAVQLGRAELCQGWGDFACAEEAYQAALAAREGSGWLHTRVGDFYRPTDPVIEHQSWQHAADQYEFAQDYRGRDPWLQERLGYVALNTGEYEAAIEHYEKAKSLTYQEAAPARLFCALAVAYEQVGQAVESADAQAECEQHAAPRD